MAVSISDTACVIEVRASEAGHAAAIVVPRGDAPPTADVMLAGGDSVPGALQYSSGVLVGSGVPLLLSLSGLQHSTPFDVHVAVQDGHSTPNVQPVVAKVLVTTAADATPPSYEPGYPMPLSVTDTTGSIQAGLDEDATVYGVALTAAADPTTIEVVAGSTSFGDELASLAAVVLPAGTVGSLVFDKLSPNTKYFAYLVAVDTSAAQNRQTAVWEVAFTTTEDTTPPDFSATPVASSVSDSAATVTFAANELCNVSFFVTPTATAPLSPSVEQVITAAPTDTQRAGRVALVSTGGGFSGSAAVAHLAHSTQYTAFAVATDVFGNVQVRAAVRGAARARVPCVPYRSQLLRVSPPLPCCNLPHCQTQRPQSLLADPPRWTQSPTSKSACQFN